MFAVIATNALPPIVDPARLLPPPTFDNVPVTVIVWTDGGRTERHGHLTPEEITARYGTRGPSAVLWTDAATLAASPGLLTGTRPAVVERFGVVSRLPVGVPEEMIRASAMMAEGRG